MSIQATRRWIINPISDHRLAPKQEQFQKQTSSARLEIRTARVWIHLEIDTLRVGGVIQRLLAKFAAEPRLLKAAHGDVRRIDVVRVAPDDT